MDPNSGHKLEIDIWVPEIKLGLEYDGEQHFRPIKFSAGTTDEEAKANLIKCQARDVKKTKLIKAHPNEIHHFVRLCYLDEIELDKIKARLTTENIPCQI